jgi:hypothetical protein
VTRRQLSKPGRGPGIALGALPALRVCALLPAAAVARPPRISEPPVISGTPQVGSTLVATGAAWDPRGGTVTWQWMRCEDTDQRSCRSIPGAAATAYTASAPDLGERLRVLLYVRDDDGSAWSLSAPSAEITSPPPPTVEPGPEPLPAPAASPAPLAPVAPAPAGEVLDERAAAPRMMRPAPVVRVRGRLTRSGARITLLTVRAPRDTRITVRCLGRGCPARRWAGTASLTRIARFQGDFRAGSRLVVSITKPGWIGKHTAIAFRRGAAPERRDRCLRPGARKPVRCPKA